MTLYLVRHGEATVEEADPKRALTEKGRLEVLKTARFLKKASVKVDRIWHSSKVRAIQTSQIIAETLGERHTCEERKGLSPNDPIEPIVEEMQKQRPESFIIVGHLPFLQKLTSFLLAGSQSAQIVKFNQAGVVCLEGAGHDGWQLLWTVTPELLTSL